MRSLAVVSVSMALAGAAFAQVRTIDIPSQDLKDALDAYIGQSGVQLVYKANDVSGLKSQAVRGAFTPEQALDRLLQGTGVTAQRGPTGAFAVVRQIRSDLGSGNAAGALARLEQARSRFPGGVLRQEREALTIQALAGSGQRAAAAERAASFVRDYPSSPYLAEIAPYVPR